MNIAAFHIANIVQDGGPTTLDTGGSGGVTNENVLIPDLSEQYYQNNIDTLVQPTMLFNGIANEIPLLEGYTYLRGQDRPARIIRRFRKEWNVVVKKVRWYRKSVGLNDLNAPTKIILLQRQGDAEVQIGEYDGVVVDDWVEFNVLVSNQQIVDGIILEGHHQHENNGHPGTAYCWPSELQVIGDWTDAAGPTFSRAPVTLGKLYGANSFWWNLNQSNDGGSANVQNMDRINRHIQMGLTTLRPFITRRHVEATQGVDTWNPTTHGWYTDLYYKTCDDFGLGGHILVMGLPPFLYETYEGTGLISPPYDGFSHPAQYFTPVHYVDRDSREDPFSYDDSAQFIYRLGLHYGAPGLGYVTSVEGLNEPDATWLGKYSHMDGAIMGAYLSAIYDGHKGAMGAGRGMKAADPNIKVCMPGLAISKPDLFRGFIDWCLANRGRKPDGSIDIPCDVINYHEYSTDGATQFSPTTTAYPPEMSRALTSMKEYIDISNRFCSSVEVWVTEWGYDTHPQSTFAPPPIGSYTIEEVVGCWAIRTILHQWKEGISGSYWFQTFPDNISDPQQFRSMRLLDHDSNKYPRMPVGDYYMQMKTYQGYVFKETLATSPWVIRAQHPTTLKDLYVIWHTEATFPTTAFKWVLSVGYATVDTLGFTEVTGTYNLAIPSASKVNIRKLQTGGSDLTLVETNVSGGIVPIPYGMFPTFVTVDTVEAAPNHVPAVSAGTDQTISFGATLNLSGSAIDSDGSIIFLRWSKILGPVEKARSVSSNVFSTGTKSFVIPWGMYFTAGLNPVRAYCTFDGYLIGTVISYTNNGDGTGTLSYNCTSTHPGFDAVSGNTYALWDIGQDSVITNPNVATTTVTNLVPGTYQYLLQAEDDDHATGRDTITITVTP